MVVESCGNGFIVFEIGGVENTGRLNNLRYGGIASGYGSVLTPGVGSGCDSYVRATFNSGFGNESGQCISYGNELI